MRIIKMAINIAWFEREIEYHCPVRLAGIESMFFYCWLLGGVLTVKSIGTVVHPLMAH